MEKLFTPDPYIVSPPRKMIKKEGGKYNLDKDCLSRATSSSSSLLAESSSHKTQNGSATTGLPRNFSPKLILKRVKLENFSLVCTKPNKRPNTSPDVQPQDKKYKVDYKRSTLPSNNVSQHKLQHAAASQGTSTSSGSHSPPLERQHSGRSRKLVKEDPVAVDLDMDFSLPLDFEVTQSSHSSGEEEQLVSLQEIMGHAIKFPDTPEKGAFSEPSTLGFCSPPEKKLLPHTYKNNLEQMLKEINFNKKAKEIEKELSDASTENKFTEFKEAEENREEAISAEQQEFLQCYSLPSDFKEVPPGEIVFNLEKFGQIFNQDTLQLRQCRVKPQGTAQKTLLWSSPAQLRLHVLIGLFQEAYSETPCPTEVTLFLFKMMSVHRETLVSDGLLKALCDIACTAACQGVNNGGLQFNVWVPSLADMTLILMNMGAAFVTLYPSENLQPLFTEEDLLEDVLVKSASPSNEERSTFPEHNSNNVLKYMSHCLTVCPRAYSDDELLLLLTVVARISLDTRLILQSSGISYLFQYQVIKSFREWETMLPRICEALTDLTDDHHNMCYLIHFLPNRKRGKQLRQHLSLAMISKLLDGRLTYRPTQNDFELSKLWAYIPRMRPSSLLQGLLNSSSNTHKDEGTHDQQAYYLCCSLLTLLNEASNLQFLFDHQKEQLLVLLANLDAHVKCDIKNSEKSFYRSKVKDLVARIDTKWQMCLQKTRPLHGKLYDYYQPVETLMSSQEEQEDGEKLYHKEWK